MPPTALSDWLSVRRPPDRTLTGLELGHLARQLAVRPALWSGLIEPRRDRRLYEQVVDDEHLNAWVIAWMEDHDTGFHDHGDSSGALAVACGKVMEDRIDGTWSIRRQVYGAGRSFRFPPDVIHRVRHGGGGPAITLHLYSPPLYRLGAYGVQADGRMVRHEIWHNEELRELDS